MGLFEELEKEMKVDPELVELKAETPETPLATQITVWVFAICLCVVMVAGTWKLLTVWF